MNWLNFLAFPYEVRAIQIALSKAILETYELKTQEMDKEGDAKSVFYTFVMYTQ